MFEWVNKLHVGNSLDILKKMPDGLFDTIITSPPYWGLRDYGSTPLIWDDPGGCEHQWGKEIEMSMSGGSGHKQDTNVGSWFESSSSFCEKCGAWQGALGLEPNPELYVKHLTDVFREAKRVLKNSGTLWLNIGDTYAGSGRGRNADGSMGKLESKVQKGNIGSYYGNIPSSKKLEGFKPKDLVGIPWMTAFALRADGWYLRSDIIWSKPNPMPESVTDRPSKAHEYVFLFSKNRDYYFDYKAVREPLQSGSFIRMQYPRYAEGSKGATGNYAVVNPEYSNTDDSRNIRSVWTISTQNYQGAHFATYPEKLVEPCIKAGTSEKGCCPKCGEPWQRIISEEERGEITLAMKIAGCNSDGSYNGVEQKDYASAKAQMPSETKKRILKSMSKKSTTIGWEPTCKCGFDLKPTRSVVFDPFMGSGTTAKVAIRLGRNWCGTELNPEYAALVEKRLSKVQANLW